MAFEELCMYCFEDREGEAICPHCGRDSRAAVPQTQMLPGSLVYQDRFLVGRALGQDADGIVYTALDTKKNNVIKLREYLPRDAAERLPDGSVVPLPGEEDAFDKGMRRLEASVQAGGDRHFYFEENGTAYVAQRKRAAAAAAEAEEFEEDTGDRRGVGKIIAIAGGIVALAAVGLVLLLSGTFGHNDVTALPTLEPGVTSTATNNVWAPAATPSPTPYVSPTFAALVDPDQSWMDYTYSGDVEADYSEQVSQSSGGSGGGSSRNTATAIPTIRPNTTTASGGTVSGNSEKAAIIQLQQRLVQLGWLNANQVTGKYDDATRQAVRDFQNYINNTVRPSEKLTVDGIAGPKTQQWLYGTDSAKPTPTPTPLVTADPNAMLTVDKNASKADIRAVQRKLIVLGLMKPGSDDGVYGNTTAQAVRSFQQRVNQLQGNNVLPITGTVDAITMAYLNYYVDWWENLQSATATPAPLDTATPAPTTTATPIPDAPEDNMTVNRYSQPESIRYLQEQLIDIGLLPAGSADGVYGDATVEAVTKLQQWVNSSYGRNVLPVTGIADAQTLQYLEYAVSNGMRYPASSPTAAPTAQPTAQPTDQPTQAPTQAPTPQITAQPVETEIPDEEENKMYVGPDSQKESIEYLQQQLISVGLLGSGADDGYYGSGTTAAVRAFQAWLNQTLGRTEVEETGIADALTLQYLEEAVDRGLRIAGTEAPTSAPTAPPTEIPTEVPTAVPTEVPTQAPTEVPVVPVDVALSISGATQSNGGYLIDEDSAVIRWAADGNVSGYNVQIRDNSGKTYLEEENTQETSITIDRASITPNTIYALTVWAIPAGGTLQDARSSTIMFATTPAPTAVPTATPEPTEAPTQAPGRIESLALAFDGSIPSGTYTMTGDSLRVNWQATGSVESYTVTLTDNSGNMRTLLENSRETSGVISRSALRAGETYTVTVVATPTGGGTPDWTDAKFAVPASGAPTPAPAAEVSAPTVNVQGNVTARDGYVELSGSSATFSWTGAGSAAGYHLSIVMVTSDGEEEMISQNMTGTSFTAPIDRLDPGAYILYVSAVPQGAENDRSQWKTGSLRFFYNVSEEGA